MPKMKAFDPNLNTIVLIVKHYNCMFDFSGFLGLRLLNKNFREAIDTLLFDVWAKIIQIYHVENGMTLKRHNMYILRNVVIAQKLHGCRVDVSEYLKRVFITNAIRVSIVSS